MPLSKITTRIVREGTTVTMTAQWRRNLDGPVPGPVELQVNGVFTATTTKADGTGPQMMTTGVDGVPALVDLLTAAQKTQLQAIADAIFVALRDAHTLTEA